MRERFDVQAKEALAALLADVGTVERGLEASAPAQRFDLYFRPDPEHRAERHARGLLGEMTDAESGLEVFYNTPSALQTRDCVRKLWTLERALVLEARSQGRTVREGRTRVWVLTTGKPRRALKAFRARPSKHWPKGVYTTARVIGLGVVVLRELPRTRETLALRILAKGATRAQACEELVHVEPDAWERRLIEILVRWRTEIPLDPALWTEEEKDFMTTTSTAFDELKASLLKEGQRKGVKKGLAPLVHQFERKLGRALSTAEHTTLRKRLRTHGPARLGDVVLDLDAVALARWIEDPAAQ